MPLRETNGTHSPATGYNYTRFTLPEARYKLRLMTFLQNDVNIYSSDGLMEKEGKKKNIHEQEAHT